MCMLNSPHAATVLPLKRGGWWQGQGQGLWHGNCNNFMHIAAISIAIRSHKNKPQQIKSNRIESHRSVSYRRANTHTHTRRHAYRRRVNKQREAHARACTHKSKHAHRHVAYGAIRNEHTLSRNLSMASSGICHRTRAQQQGVAKRRGAREGGKIESVGRAKLQFES